VARLELDRRDFAPIKQSGLRAVGADLAGNGAAEETLIRQAQRFERATYAAGLVAYLHGVRSATMVHTLRGAYAYLSGDAVAPLTDVPARIPALDFAEA
jgi:hypothetical protein